MQNYQISDPLFREAVAAIDTGNVILLESLLAENPWLVKDRLLTEEEGYFKDPYLFWFIAGNPVRQPKLAANIIQVASTIIAALKREKVENIPDQLGYTLALVCSGRVPRESGVQLDLIDLLVAEGVQPEGGYGPAVAHRETAALEHLLKKGGQLTLIVAIATGRIAEAKAFIPSTSAEERQTALAVAAFYGNAEILAALIKTGVDISAFCPDGFHSHSTPLHQAIAADNLPAVKVLVEAGADLHIRDRAFLGTPIGWAIHLEQPDIDGKPGSISKNISTYIRGIMARVLADDLQKAGLLAKEQIEQAVPIISKKLGV